MSKKTQVELKTELPDLVKSKGLVSTTKTTGDSMRTMLTDIIDSFTIPEDAALIAHNATGSVIPIGIIVMWSPLKSPSVDKDGGFGVSVGSIPKGWAICDGSNGTPDLRSQFILGSNDAFPSDVIGHINTTFQGSAGSVSYYPMLFIMYKGIDFIPIVPTAFAVKGVGTTTNPYESTISVNWLDGGTGIYAANYFKVHAVNTSSGSDVTVNGVPYNATDSNITKYYYYPPGAGSTDWKAVIPGLISGQSYYVYVEGYNSLGLVSTTVASKVTVTTKGSVAAPAITPTFDASTYPYTCGIYAYWGRNTNETTELEYSTDVLFGTSTKVAGSYSYNHNRVEAFASGLPVNTEHYYRQVTVGTTSGIPYKTWSYVESYMKYVDYPIVTHYAEDVGGDSRHEAYMKVRGTAGSYIKVRIYAAKWSGGGGWIKLEAGKDFKMISSTHRATIDSNPNEDVDIWEVWELKNDNIDCVAYLGTDNLKNHTSLSAEAFDMGGTSLKGPRMDLAAKPETYRSYVRGN